MWMKNESIGSLSQQISRSRPASTPSSIAARSWYGTSTRRLRFLPLPVGLAAALRRSPCGRPATGWAACDRAGAGVRRSRPRAFDDRLVVAGEKAVRRAERRNPDRPEVLLEEFARLLGVVRLGCRSPCGTPRTARRYNGRALRIASVPRRIALQLCVKAANAAADRPRPSPRCRAQAIGSYCVSASFSGSSAAPAPRRRGRAGSARRRRVVQFCAADRRRPDVIARLRWRPASSWDRARLMSRAKVHTSVTSVTLSGLPSITLPARSRVTETSCDTKRTVTCALLPRTSAPMMSAASIETNRVSTVSPRCSRSLIAASKPS